MKPMHVIQGEAADDQHVMDALHALRRDRVAGRIEVVMDGAGRVMLVDVYPLAERTRRYHMKSLDRQPPETVESR